MNTRASRILPWRRLAAALVVSVTVLAFPCASAQAGCGSHEARASVALEWTQASARPERTAPADRLPTCSGPLCSRTSLPPIMVTLSPQRHLDINVGVPIDPVPDRTSDTLIEQFDGLNPIGRVTEVERPPCRPGSANQAEIDSTMILRASGVTP